MKEIGRFRKLNFSDLTVQFISIEKNVEYEIEYWKGNSNMYKPELKNE